MLRYVFCSVLMLYTENDWFYTSYLDLMLIHVICGHLVLYSKTVTTIMASFVGPYWGMGLNPVVAVISKFYAKDVTTIDMTDFFGYAMLWLLTL